MDRPQVDTFPPAHQLYLMQRTSQLSRYLAREQHVETMLTDLPRNQLPCLRNHDCLEAVQGESVLVRGDQACGGAVGKYEKSEHLLQVLRLLKVQRAQLQI